MEETFVIVGGGIAGVSCAETLAFLNPNKNIILLTKSKLIKAVTNLVPVSKMLFDFNVEEKETSELCSTYPNITIVEDSLIYISTKECKIKTFQEREIKYKYLCLCLGAQPKLIDTNDCSSYVIGIRDTDSVNFLQKKIKNSHRIVIVGNGGIASELIYELENIEIVWVIKDDHVSATFLDPGASQFFQSSINMSSGQQKENTYVKRLRYSESENLNKGGAALGPDWQKKYSFFGANTTSKSIIIEYKCEVASIARLDKKSRWPISVFLTNGKNIECDLIISATGVSPCSQINLDDQIKLSSDGGIEVDYKMETSLPNIFAAGDVCTASWEIAKHWFQMRLWSQARQMGCYAAKCMTSVNNTEEVMQDFCFELFAHSTKLFGYKVALLGLYNGQKLNNQYECLLRVTPGIEYIKLIIVNGCIQGAVLIGDTGLEETIENLILNQLDVSSYGDDLLNPNIDIEDYFD